MTLICPHGGSVISCPKCRAERDNPDRRRRIEAAIQSDAARKVANEGASPKHLVDGERFPEGSEL